MCFIANWQVDDVEEPLYETVIGAKISGDDILAHITELHSIRTAINLFINNSTITEAMKQVEKHGATIGMLTTDMRVANEQDRVVALCGPLAWGLGKIDPEAIHPDLVKVSHDVRLGERRIYTFQLKDFSCFAQFSITQVPADELPEGIKIAYKVKVRPNFDSEAICVYEFPDPRS